MTSPLRVLCLDIEGGYGGSSRSLFQSVSHMDRAHVSIEVWCRRDGPVRARYKAIGIPCRVMSAMPHVTSLPRFSRNAYVFLNHAVCWSEGNAFRAELASAVRHGFDLVHFNHEGLFLLMRWLRREFPQVPMVACVRTFLPANLFSRWQYRTIADAADQTLFITENERDNVARLTGRSQPGRVIYNIASPPATPVALHSSIPRDGRLKVAVLANYAFVRGTDRVVDVAEALASHGRRDILFIMAGDMTLRGSLPGELGRIARDGGTLADYAALRGVADMFLFLCHVAEPERVLVSCDVLLKPTREDNPWGRDILEALAAGKPVVSIGRYDRFVETGRTGVLMPVYDAATMAEHLLRLDADRALCERMGVEARARVATLCDGPSRAADLLNLWCEAVAARQGTMAA